MKKRRRKIRPRCLLFLSLLVVFCVAVVMICKGPDPNGVYAVAKNGSLADSITVKGLFLYEETVVTAEEAGTYYPGISTGNGVAAGEVCGEFHRLNDLFAEPVTMLTSPVSGIYSSRIDGWEDILTSDQLSSLDLPAVMESYEEPAEIMSSFLRRGDPCFKVMDNKKNLVFLADLGTVTLSEENVTFLFHGERMPGKVLEQKYFGENTFALISIVPVDQCYVTRSVEMELILDEKDGIVVDASAVTKRFGEVGVYCISDGELQFCPVTVLCENNEKCLVSGISAGDRLLCIKS